MLFRSTNQSPGLLGYCARAAVLVTCLVLSTRLLLAEYSYADGWRHAGDYWRAMDALTAAEDLYPFDHRFREAPPQRAAGWLKPR